MIQTLKGYHNTNPNLSRPGILLTKDAKHTNILDFDPSIFTLEDYAKKLSRLNRYLGDTKLAYNVAQHSVIGANALLMCGLVNEAKAFMCHDMSECITNDLSPILKSYIGDKYSDLEKTISNKIYKHFEIPLPVSPLIKAIDKNLASYEISILLKSDLGFDFDYWSEEKSYCQFLFTWEAINTMLSYQ